MKTLYYFQKLTRFKVNKLLNAKKNPLIVMPTGTGKTFTDTTIIEDRVKLGKRVYLISPNKEVFDQWMKELAHLNPGYCNDEGLRGRDRNVYVCMAMSLYNRLNLIDESLYPDEIHTDEAHHSPAGTNEAIYAFFDKAQRLGMTATPLRYDNKPLGDLYSDLINEINIKEAFEKNFLTPYLYIGPEEWIDFIPGDDEDINAAKQADILGTPKIIGDALEIYERLGEGKPWIIPCCTHEHAVNVRKEFSDAGWIAEHLHGTLAKSERDRIVKTARSGNLNVITTVGVGVEGMDIPGLFGILWLRRTGSLTIWKQFNGRVLRLMKGKEITIIADLAGNAVLHGMPDKVYKWSLTAGAEEMEQDHVPFIKCWSCGTYNNPMNTECHWCGAEIGEGSEPKDGTCRKCSHRKKISANVFMKDCGQICPVWMEFPGCPSFKKKSRSLPAMIDGKLIAITTDGERQEIASRAEVKKGEQLELIREKEKRRNTAEKISSVEKRAVLNKGLFADVGRRSLFKEALEG